MSRIVGGIGSLEAASLALAAAADGRSAAAPPEERLGQIRYAVPAGYAKVSESTDTLPSPIPGQKGTRETFRGYDGPGGLHLYLFHWDGVPSHDRGPMAVEQRWDATIGGRTGTVSLTRLFFGVEQRVLVAHFGGPDGHSYLVYATTDDKVSPPDREAFLRFLATVRFD